MIRLYSFNY